MNIKKINKNPCLYNSVFDGRYKSQVFVDITLEATAGYLSTEPVLRKSYLRLGRRFFAVSSSASWEKIMNKEKRLSSIECAEDNVFVVSKSRTA